MICLLRKKFPSFYRVLFILIEKLESALLATIILKFPSPYGVLFILIRVNKAYYREMRELCEFPSPYRVSFILMEK